MSQTTQAKIVYTPTHHVIGKNGRYKLDLNHDKIADLTLLNTRGCNTDYCIDAVSAIASRRNGIEGTMPLAYALKPGALIGPKAHFSGQLMASTQSSQGSFGQWLNVTNGYLGVKFIIKGKIHYGWARLTVQVLGGASIKTTLTGFAYETIPNKAIIAGKTIGPDETNLEAPNASLVAPAKEPASLGMLALGAPALAIWRYEGSEAAQAPEANGRCGDNKGSFALKSSPAFRLRPIHCGPNAHEDSIRHLV
jgi:hypothetical protein